MLTKLLNFGRCGTKNLRMAQRFQLSIISMTFDLSCYLFTQWRRHIKMENLEVWRVVST